MDAALSTDRAYFDANGRLIFHFSNRSTGAVASRTFEDVFDRTILDGRQSPLAAVLAAVAVLVFGFVSVQSSLFTLTRIATANTLETTAQGFGTLSTGLAISIQQKTAGAYSQLWGGDAAARVLPFTEFAVRAQGDPLRSVARNGEATGRVFKDIESVEQMHSASLAAAVLASVTLSSLTPSAVLGVTHRAYLAVGMEIYGGITASMQAYKSLIMLAGVQAYALGGVARSAIAAAPAVLAQGLTALGGTIISTTHLAIATETSLVYQFVDISPRVARGITLAVGNSGAYLGTSVATRVPRALAWAVQEPSIAGPAMSQFVVSRVYGSAQQFVYATGALRATYGRAVTQTGNGVYALVVGTDALKNAAIGTGTHALAVGTRDVYSTLVRQGVHLLSAAYAGARALAAPSGQ